MRSRFQCTPMLAGVLMTAWALAAGPAFAQFCFEEDGGALTVFEGDRPVLAYQTEPTEPPPEADPALARGGYIHPLYGIGGEVVTQDYPSDHYHHRGVFWGWPECMAGDRRMDTWLALDAKQVFNRWLERDAGADRAVLAVQNAWQFAGEDEPIVRERVHITIHPETDGARAIDFRLEFENVSGADFTLAGAAGKGYGGFNFRPDAANKPLAFTTADGPLAKDALKYDTPWADVSWTFAGTDRRAGVAIVQHPANPDYPHHGWLLRHYGFNGAAWPHEEPHTLAPGETLTLRYRLLVHTGSADDAGIAEHYEAYRNNAAANDQN